MYIIKEIILLLYILNNISYVNHICPMISPTVIIIAKIKPNNDSYQSP